MDAFLPWSTVDSPLMNSPSSTQSLYNAYHTVSGPSLYGIIHYNYPIADALNTVHWTPIVPWLLRNFPNSLYIWADTQYEIDSKWIEVPAKSLKQRTSYVVWIGQKFLCRLHLKFWSILCITKMYLLPDQKPLQSWLKHQYGCCDGVCIH